MAEINTTEMPDLMPSSSLTRQQVRQSTQFFHPQDSQVFFIATFDETDSAGCLSVYEFRENLCTRIFTLNLECPIEVITHNCSSWNKLGLYDGTWESDHDPDLGAKRADAHGTYHLLEFRERLEGTQLIYFMFCAFSTSFSARIFEPPPGYDFRLGEPAFIWNGQLYLNASRHSVPYSQILHPSPLLVLQSVEAGTSHRRKRPSTQWKEDERQLSAVQEEMLTSALMPHPGPCRFLYGHAEKPPTPKKDIVRYQDISRAYPHATDFHSESGLLYMFSLHEGDCTAAGPHNKGCTWYLPAASPERTAAAGTGSLRNPVNCFAHGDDEGWEGAEAEAIFGDDDFLIVVSTQDSYTVFAVDADRKMAKALIEGPNDSEDVMDTGV